MRRQCNKRIAPWYVSMLASGPGVKVDHRIWEVSLMGPTGDNRGSDDGLGKAVVYKILARLVEDHFTAGTSTRAAVWISTFSPTETRPSFFSSRSWLF